MENEWFLGVPIFKQNMVFIQLLELTPNEKGDKKSEKII